MRLDNNPNYNTKQSDVKAFKDFVPDAEKKDLTKLKDTSLKNQGELGNINVNGRLRFNKVTKTWQKLSKPEIKDKLTALEKLKTFEQVINEEETALGSEINIENFYKKVEMDINENKQDILKLIMKHKDDIDAYSRLIEIQSLYNNIGKLIKPAGFEF